MKTERLTKKSIARTIREYRASENLDQYVMEAVRKRIKAYREHQLKVAESARNEVKPWFDDPANADIIKTQGKWMFRQLEKPGARWYDVRDQAMMRYHIKQLNRLNPSH